MTKTPLKTHGDSEDIEMEDGTGSRLHTNQTVKSHLLDINTLLFLSELS